jgi:hypothetical protein
MAKNRATRALATAERTSRFSESGSGCKAMEDPVSVADAYPMLGCFEDFGEDGAFVQVGKS